MRVVVVVVLVVIVLALVLALTLLLEMQVELEMFVIIALVNMMMVMSEFCTYLEFLVGCVCLHDACANDEFLVHGFTDTQNVNMV